MSDSTENKHSKVFVGGISIHTTDDGFRDAFAPFGDITDSIILRDPESNRSRGFGFVTFANTNSVDEVLNSRPITIDDREVDVKRAIPKEANNPQAHARTNKVFIGGLPNDISKDELKSFFSDKGEISNVELVHKEGVFKGFGFITFTDCDTADKVIVDGEYDIRRNKRFCRVSKAGNRGKQVPFGYPSGMAGGYPAASYGGHQSHSASSYYGADDSFYPDYEGGYTAPKSGYMGPPSGGGGYMAHGNMGYTSGYTGGHGGYTGGPPSSGYESRYNQHQSTPYNPGPTNYSSDYSYGYGGHGSGVGAGGSGPGYTGGSGGSYPYKGDGGMRGTGSGGGRGGRSRYKPY
eukprot:TRINITY_DN22303_c0_g1_i1.p1 TRINITY_DN22303_c0_g1~~TRINITY_DN22303_c0_g1_i1.p1  ORF type:complete len:365 (-),score=73.95 TRINITY_DN22303_c0_g1_i1:228-1271(-)